MSATVDNFARQLAAECRQNVRASCRPCQPTTSLAEEFGKDVRNGRILIQQKVNQSDLAAMAGIARENVSRVLKDWTEHEMVSRLADYYCLEKKDAIQREAEP